MALARSLCCGVDILFTAESNCRYRNFLIRTSRHRTYGNLVEVFDDAGQQRDLGQDQDVGTDHGTPGTNRGPPTPSPRGARRFSSALERQCIPTADAAAAATTTTRYSVQTGDPSDAGHSPGAGNATGSNVFNAQGDTVSSSTRWVRADQIATHL